MTYTSVMVLLNDFYDHLSLGFYIPLLFAFVVLL